LSEVVEHLDLRTGRFHPLRLLIIARAAPQDVLSIRLSACDVLEKNGVTRGRVMMRGDSPGETKNADNPDVVWEGEFPDAASLSRYEEIADKDPDFVAARQKMNAVTRITERRYYQLH
jgi:hypothetical protein